MKKIIFPGLLALAFTAGWFLKPQPEFMKDETLELAKKYCEETLKYLPNDEKPRMEIILNSLNKGSINLNEQGSSGWRISDPNNINYLEVMEYAEKYKKLYLSRFKPEPEQKTTSRISL